VKCRVIDTIEYRDSWTHRYPEFAARGVRTLAVIDPEDLTDPDGISGRIVTVCRPDADGTRLQLRADISEAPSGTLGLFFRGRTPADIPRGSTMEW
jgi:hypothetical protein